MEKHKLPAQERIAGMLGLAARAGRITVGCDQTTEAVRIGSEGNRRRGKICLVLLAKDAAQNTCKRAKNCCTYYETEYAGLPLTAEQIAHAIGKTGAVSVMALTDVHFSSALKAILQTNEQADEPQEV